MTPPRLPARDGGRLTRRGLLTAAAAAGSGALASCTVGTGAAGAGPTATTTTTVTASPTAPTGTTTGATTGPATGTTATAPAPVVLPEAPVPWTPLPVEVLPACKQAAVDLLVAVMTVEDDGRDEAGLAARLAPLGVTPEVAHPLLGLLPPVGPAALQVVYSQYGGLDEAEERASQMVVGEQLLLDGAGALVRRPFAADVRLSLQGGRWTATAVVPAYPDPPLPPLGPAVEALLVDDRVELTGVAAADLRSGVVAENVAVTLLELAGRWRPRVHVFRSGHPVNVFPTTRPSAHSVGRAVDVTALDGLPVVQRDAAPWREFMEAALAAGASVVGGPEEVRPAAASFTDRVHQDHVHLAFPRPEDRGI